MIYTVTFNPAIDYVLHLTAPLAVGEINRTSDEACQFGGKGINVSGVLRELGCESIALGFTAGETGAWLERGLQLSGLKTRFIRLPDGGGYMMPDGDRFHLVNGENWFDCTVSADAAGIILTSLVINRQLWLYHDSGDVGLTQLYRMRDAQLWRHIEFHPECNAIYAALD